MSGKPAATEPIALTLAARSADIPARTLRNWIASGKLAAIRGQRGWLVRMSDIFHIAATIDSHAASNRPTDGMAAGLAATVAAEADDNADNAANPASQAAIAATDRRVEAEALVQQILAPFVAEQTRLAEEVGRERQRREQAEGKRDELRRRAEAAEVERDRLIAAQDSAG